MKNAKTRFNGKFHDAVSPHGPHIKFNSKLGGQRVEIHRSIWRKVLWLVVFSGMPGKSMNTCILKRHKENTQQKTRRKPQPGDSSRDLFSPQTLEVTNNLWVRGTTSPSQKNRSQSQNCQVVVTPKKLAICKEPWQSNTWQLRHLLSRCYIYLYLPWVYASWFMIGQPSTDVTMLIIMFLNDLLSIQSRSSRWDTVDGTCLSIGPNRTLSIHPSWLKIGPLISNSKWVAWFTASKFNSWLLKNIYLPTKKENVNNSNRLGNLMCSKANLTVEALASFVDSFRGFKTWSCLIKHHFI